MENKIILASEGMGSWGEGIIQHLFHLAGYETEFKNCDEAKIIITSMFFNHEGIFQKKLPYITWIGETEYPPRRNYPPLFELITFNSYRPGDVILQYFISVFFEMQTRLNMKFNLDDLRLNKEFSNRPYMLAYCASNSQTHRDTLFRLIQQKEPTAHGLGKCCGTPGHQVGEHATWRDNWQHFQKYRFTLAMENKIVPGYVTEKLLMPIMAGSIPIYFGDPSWVKRVLNEKAIIFVQDFPSLEACAEYILKVDRDPALLNEYQSQPIFVKEKGLFSETNPCDEYKKCVEIIKSAIQ